MCSPRRDPREPEGMCSLGNRVLGAGRTEETGGWLTDKRGA